MDAGIRQSQQGIRDSWCSRLSIRPIVALLDTRYVSPRPPYLIKTRPEAGPQDRSEIKKRNREVVAAAQGDVFFLFFRVMVDSKHEERD